MFYHLKITQKLWLLITSIVIVLLIVFNFYFINQIEKQFRDGLIKKAVSLVQISSVHVGASLFLNERSSLEKILKSLENDPDVVFIYVSDRNNKTTFGYHYHTYYKLVRKLLESNQSQTFSPDFFILKQSLFYRDEYQGNMVVGFSLDWVKKQTSWQKRNLIIISLIIGIIFIFISTLLSRAISRPLREAAQHLNQYPESEGRFNLRLPVRGKDETAQLAKAFNRLADDLDRHIKQLDESKRYFETLFHLSPIPVIIADSLGKIEGVNDSACKFFGIDREILLRINLDRFISNEDLNAMLNRVIKERQNLRGYITNLRMFDGRKRVVELNIASREDDEEYVRNIIIAVIDVTENLQIQREILSNQKKLQKVNEELRLKTEELERLRERDRKNAYKLSQLIQISQRMIRATKPNQILRLIISEVRSLIEADECFIFFRDSKADQMILTLSYPEAAQERLLRHDYQKSSLLWRVYKADSGSIFTASDLFGSDEKFFRGERNQQTSVLAVPISEKEYRFGVMVFVKYDQPYFYNNDLHLLNTLANQVAILLDNINLLNAVKEKAASLEKAYSDLQESQRQVIQLQKMESLGTLVGGIAHDFNNILGIIMPNIDMLRNEANGNPKILRRTQIIQEASQRAAELTRQLLMFSRNQDVDLQVLSPNEFLTQISSMLKRTLGKEYEILLDLDPEVENIKADETRLSQVILNLALNSRDAMPEGGEIVLRTRMQKYRPRSETDNGLQDYVCISVTDSGNGIKKEHLDKIFDPFFTTKSVGKGTGMGLAVVFGIVQSHNGHIEVESKENQGTTFYLYFPPVKEQIDQEASARGDGIPHGTENILVVDDERLIRDSVEEILTSLGYNVLCASSGPEAIEMVQNGSEKIHLAIVDMSMPKMNGVETIRRIHAIDPDIKILLSSGRIERERLITPDIKLHGILPKPYRLRELALKVRQILNKKVEASA